MTRHDLFINPLICWILMMLPLMMMLLLLMGWWRWDSASGHQPQLIPLPGWLIMFFRDAAPWCCSGWVLLPGMDGQDFLVLPPTAQQAQSWVAPDLDGLKHLKTHLSTNSSVSQTKCLEMAVWVCALAGDPTIFDPYPFEREDSLQVDRAGGVNNVGYHRRRDYDGSLWKPSAN